MKRCPTCQQTYDDDALSFCPADGTRLESERSSSGLDLQATIMAPPPPPMSQSFGTDPVSGYETNVAPSTPSFETSTPPMQTPSWASIPTTTPQPGAPPAPAPQRLKPMTAYIIIGASIIIAGFLLFIWLIGLVAGIGGALIHLLLLLALLVGFIGIVGGVLMLVMSKKQ
jgi:hypothetical protein